MERPHLLHFIIVKDEEKRYTAICVERYIAAQGKSIEDAMKRLKIAYRADLDYSLKVAGEAFKNIPPAPAKYQKMLDSHQGYELRGIIFDDLQQSELQLAA